MDEGDEYVPQISQLDYSLVAGGQGVMQGEPSIYSTETSQMGAHHMQYGDGSLIQQRQVAPQMQQMGGMMGMNLMTQPATPAPKAKTPRRRKNAQTVVEQQTAPPQMMTVPSAAATGMMVSSSGPPSQQQYMSNAMSPMQSMAAMSQNPTMSQMRIPNMQAAMMAKPAGDISMRQVHDLYGQQQQQQQQQQQWYQQQQQQYRPPSGYGQQIYAPRPAANQLVSQANYYHPQQDGRGPAPPGYYQQQGYPPQMNRYGLPQPMAPPSASSHAAQQYYPEQSQGYYGPQSGHMLGSAQSQGMPGVQQQPPAQAVADWPHTHAQRYPSTMPPSQQYPSSLQIEIQQVQQQLQTMYDIPNRNIQTAQQIEQLQMRLQYLQQCSINECRGVPQRAPDGGQQQPVSVMQRGSEVQVNIKPDVPGHTLISVYHQYPTNAPPASTSQSSENVSSKDCVPPEPIPSTLRKHMDSSPLNTEISSSMNSRLGPPAAPIGTPTGQVGAHVGSMGASAGRVSATAGNPSAASGPATVSMSASIGQISGPTNVIPSQMMGSMPPSNSGMSSGAPISPYVVPPAPSIAAQNGVEERSPYSTENQQPQTSTLQIISDPYGMSKKQLSETGPCISSDAESSNGLVKSECHVAEVSTISACSPKTEEGTREEEEAVRTEQVPMSAHRSNFEQPLEQKLEVLPVPHSTASLYPRTSAEGKVEIDAKAEAVTETMGDELPECSGKGDTKEEEKVDEKVKEVQEGDVEMNGDRREADEENAVDDERQEDDEGDEQEGNGRNSSAASEDKSSIRADENMDENSIEDEEEQSVEESESKRLLKENENNRVEGREVDGRIIMSDNEEERAKIFEEDDVSKDVSVSRDSTTITTEEQEEPEAKMRHGKKRSRPPKKVTLKKRRRDDEDVSDEPEDDEFLPEPSKRSRRGNRSRRKDAVDSYDSAVMEFVEKRRSGRTTGAETKSYDLQAKWDEMEEELIEKDAGTPPLDVKKEEPSEYIVEKVMSVRKNEDGPDTYFVKYKNKAYVHCEWKTQAELEAGDKRAAGKLKRFLQKRNHSSDQDDEEQFNSDYVVVERVIDMSGEEDSEYVLVKWRSLPYEEATWEVGSSVPKEKIDAYIQRNKIDPLKVKPPPRPPASDWRKIPDDTTFKDGNSLREYQFEGVNWLLYCYYNRQNCILADEMGLGKTVQTICFLQRIYDYGIHGPFLIVVPLSTVHNWQREFETWTDMNAIVYHGSAASRQLIQQSEFYYKEDQKARKNVAKFDALITTFEMVVSDCDIIRKISYHICVIDEAHRLKNRNCKLLTGGLLSFTVEHRLLLTGTPLQNNIEELYSLLNFLEPEQFHSSTAFLEQFGQCQTEDQVQKLQEILKPMMLRRLKEDVEKSLQPKEETIIEIQLSNTQKKYYRAILERNFSHLCKGTSVPSLMNAMMELRKCCNHPFLINGAEEQIMSEMKAGHPEWSEDELYQNALVQSSGKLVLIAKLLPKLRADGHKVLIFSQMVRVLDIIEEFLIAQNYTFERIDGNVRGDLRQSAIDRFSKKDSDRFVFLLCTRAGGLGINLTAADTVIIFDSDWNPQNDLQAQARCHRIGQTKMVKVYRLITCNTYEREMFDKASLKLGLDKAVLQSTTALKDNSQQLSRKEVEELLKKGAYGAIMDENAEESKFNEEDIETILLRRTTTITLEAGVKGSTFAKASFNSSTNREDIDIDDPNFWSKWAKKANIDTEMSQTEKELILLEPRNRKKRFEENVYKTEGGEDSEGDESDESGKGRKRGERKGDRKRRREDEEYRPDELAFNKSEYFKVEKLLGQFGWGRWKIMREGCDLKETVTEADIEHISRTLLLHCIREYRGDDKVREFVWRLIIPKGGQVAAKVVPKKKSTDLSTVFHEGWAALPEFNPPAFAVDSSFQRHVHRHANKLLVRMHQLHILNSEVIGSQSDKIMGGANANEVDLVVEMAESFLPGWDNECDKSFLIGAHKHGLENFEAIRADEKLCFVTKGLETFPSGAELLGRFRRLLTYFQRKRNDTITSSTWTRREEAEFMRVLRSYGVKDDPSTIISWTRFKQLSPLLEMKSDSELMEQLYCVLSMCTKQLGNEMSSADLQRAMKVEAISARKAQKLMHRMNMMRQIHDWSETLKDRMSLLKLCSTEAMPNGWSAEQDEDLFVVVDANGLDNISANIAHRPAFQKVIRPEEKTLLRRVAEIYTTLQTKKWNGAASIELLEDSDEERTTPVQVRTKRGRKKGSLSNGTSIQDLMDAEKEKMRALVHHSFLQRLEQLPFAAAAAMAQGAYLLPSLLSTGATPTQQAAVLSSLFGLPPPMPSPSSTPSATATKPVTPVVDTGSNDDVLNLSTKSTSSSSASLLDSVPSTSSAAQPSSAALLNTLNFSELLALANLPPETRVPVVNVETGARLIGDQAPKVKNLGQWLSAHPKYVLDINSTATATTKTANSSATTSGTTQNTSGTTAVVTNIEHSKQGTEQRADLVPVISTADLNAEKATPKKDISPRKNSLTDHSKDLSANQVPGSSKNSTLSLEPGEIPKPSSSGLSTQAHSATNAALASLPDQPVAVFQRSTGTLLSSDRWPLLKSLATWLDMHPDYNVHSSSVPFAATVLSKNYGDRLGGETLASTPLGSASGMEALQMQMMLQQSLMNQSLLGLSAYGPLGPYMLAAVASGSSQSNKMGLPKDVLNPMLASMMSPSTSSLQLQQMQALLGVDPSLLLAAHATSMVSPLLPTSLGSVSSLQSKQAPTSSSSSAKKSSTAKGRLNAVVEKLSSNQL